ncbi:serine/threonine protein phosphatase, putative [Eimeria praecox]|uniref:Serine/threonine protein phosphatase, putative n=1 Tax=Eimeria praecox TaxID=51316 RepID=U6H7Y9_9EIME|nr:serine/threonine protein phosphatase, putative [Eimeria praecox]
MVVGHTVQESFHVETYCKGKLLAIDTGISKYVANSPHAIEVTPDGEVFEVSVHLNNKKNSIEEGEEGENIVEDNTYLSDTDIISSPKLSIKRRKIDVAPLSFYTLKTNNDSNNTTTTAAAAEAEAEAAETETEAETTAAETEAEEEVATEEEEVATEEEEVATEEEEEETEAATIKENREDRFYQQNTNYNNNAAAADDEL